MGAHQQMAFGRKETHKMSYILDALKKLENEKAKKARNDGMMSISGALLRDEPRRPSGGNAWKIATVVVVAVSLIALAGTWFVLHGDKRRVSRSAAVVVQPPPVARVVPPPAAPPVAAVQPAAPVPPQPAPSVRPVVPPKPQAVVPSISKADDDTPLVAAKKQAVRLRKQKGGGQQAVGETSVAPAISAPPADIKVSGIAWQDERSARRAVVNGFLMREGGVVAGARITEILRDRVRFSAGDKVFEAPLMMNVAPGAGK